MISERKNISYDAGSDRLFLHREYGAAPAQICLLKPTLTWAPPVTLGKAPNGAIANQELLDRIEDFNWLKPTIENPAEGVWVFGGYGLAPISIIEAEDGLIAFDTGDTKHDGELMLAAIRTVSQKPIKVIIYGHSHTGAGAGVLAEGNKNIMTIGHPGLNEVVAENLGFGRCAVLVIRGRSLSNRTRTHSVQTPICQTRGQTPTSRPLQSYRD